VFAAFPEQQKHGNHRAQAAAELTFVLSPDYIQQRLHGDALKPDAGRVF
jgi:hypothetical protein